MGDVDRELRATAKMIWKLNVTQIKILISLLFIDLTSKITAFLLLSDDKFEDQDALFQLVLSVNPTGLGSAAHNLFYNSQGRSEIVEGALFTFGIGFLLVVLARLQKLSTGALILYSIALTILVFFISSTISFPAFIVNNSALFLRASQGFLWLVVWVLVHSRFWKLGALLFASAALGNFLSFLYPPYGIVDFMWSVPLNRIIGFGVFNFADIFWIFGIGVFTFAILDGITKRLKAWWDVAYSK